MRKSYPSRENMTFLICESIRNETNGKKSFLGAYVGFSILTKNDPPLNLPSLAFIFIFEDGAGTFESRIQIENPTGEIYIDAQMNKSVIEPNIPHNSIVSMTSPIFKEFGTYKFRLLLDAEPYEREIVIRKASADEVNRFSG